MPGCRHTGSGKSEAASACCSWPSPMGKSQAGSAVNVAEPASVWPALFRIDIGSIDQIGIGDRHLHLLEPTPDLVAELHQVLGFAFLRRAEEFHVARLVIEVHPLGGLRKIL